MKIFGRFKKTTRYLCVGEMKKSRALVGYFGLEGSAKKLVIAWRYHRVVYMLLFPPPFSFLLFFFLRDVTLLFGGGGGGGFLSLFFFP